MKHRQGMMAGTNAAEGYDTYEGALSTFASLIGKLGVAATGFNEFFAKSAGFEIISGKVFGGQAIGEGAGARINVVALAIKCGMDVYALCQTEMATAPGWLRIMMFLIKRRILL